MHLLLPADPFDARTPDEAYADEARAFQDAGFGVSLFSFEEFTSGSLKARPPLPAGAEVLYRGWMLTDDEYRRLADAVAARSAHLRTSTEQYRRCHYLPGWYALCADLTPRTLFIDENAALAPLLEDFGAGPYFVKDHVKSLSTGRGSVARTADEVAEVISLIRQFRGQIEGGVCIREFIELLPGSEERFFVVNRRPAASAGDECPAIVQQVAERIASPFYSIDVARRADGSDIVIELGDGQVSDCKAWPASRLVQVLAAAT